jgi:prepilin-type N-terminal cleavage/methylation domain-containing protein
LKNRDHKTTAAGFSLVELLIAMTIMLVALALVSTLFARSLNTRQRESNRTDALTAAQAALNVISREIANSGYGLTGNGIVLTDSNSVKLHFQSNIKNDNTIFTDPGENLTYYFDSVNKSILRHDANGNGPNNAQTSTIINRISSLGFQYFDYLGTGPPTGPNPTPTINTSRVRVTVSVLLEHVQGQANPQSVVLVSDITLRNSDFMLRQY